MACITEAAGGFPNGNGDIRPQCATLAEMLVERGFNTAAVGKWHLTAEDEMNLASTRRNWPLGRGFDRFYGFLGAETNQWYPDLVHDNYPVDPPATPEQGYHLTVDLTDQAIRFVDDVKAIAPDRRCSCTTPLGLRTPRTTCPRSGPRNTAGSSTRGTSGPGRSFWPGRRRWASSRPAPSCRRSTRSAPPWIGGDRAARRSRTPVRADSRSAEVTGHLTAGLGANGDDQELHKARKAPDGPGTPPNSPERGQQEEERNSIRRYQELQDILGEHQDAVMAADLLLRIAPPAPRWHPDGNGFTCGLLYAREPRRGRRAGRRLGRRSVGSITGTRQ